MVADRDVEAAREQQEDLLQLLYLCPVAIAKLDRHGAILLMNPYGAQMLMPLSPDGKLANLFDLFEPFAPEVGEMARRFAGRTGKVCDEHHVMLPKHQRSSARAIVSITLQKVDTQIFVAVLTDVTSAAGRENVIRLSEERLHAVLDGVADYAICTLDMAGTITSWNRGAVKLDDYRSDETIGRHVDFLVPTNGSSKSVMKRALDVALREGSHQFEGWRVRKDGTRYWGSTAIGVLFGKNGQTPIGFSVTTQDLTEQRRSEDRLRTLAMTDPLTGVLNRRSFFETAKAERTRPAPPGVLSVLLLDADHFKAINDTYGHDAGDTVLQRIVADCRKELRTSDVLGRLGGEEFAILLPTSTPDNARLVAERVRDRIAASGLAPGAIPCTVSIGIAVAQSDSETVEAMISRADNAMYRAKDAGRNCVIFADDQPA